MGLNEVDVGRNSGDQIQAAIMLFIFGKSDQEAEPSRWKKGVQGLEQVKDPFRVMGDIENSVPDLLKAAGRTHPESFG